MGGPPEIILFFRFGFSIVNHPASSLGVSEHLWNPPSFARTVILAASVRKALVVGLFPHVKWCRFETSNPKPQTQNPRIPLLIFAFFLNHGFRAVLGLDRWVRNGQYHTYTKVVNF